MRKKRVKVLFFSKNTKLTSEEFAQHRAFKNHLRNMYDEETTELAMLIRNASVPQHMEPCDYVCGYIPTLFSKISVLTLPEVVVKAEVKPAIKQVRKKEVITDVH